MDTWSDKNLLVTDSEKYSSMELEPCLIPTINVNSLSNVPELEKDIKLQDQILSLKQVLEKLQKEIENKDINIARIARDKEKLSLDLAKQRRSNATLLKQLEDERKFYFREKEIYCQEMNEFKEFKKSVSISTISLNDQHVQELKADIEKLKTKLNQTTEANYNLGIKFLRIKNTKSFLKNELLKRKAEHEKVTQDLKSKISFLSDEIEDIIKQRFQIYISPSNRKYIQLVRQNSSLIHENLTLYLEIERLNSQFDKIKLKYTKSETNNRLKYMHSIKSETMEKCSIHNNHKHVKKDSGKKVRIKTDLKQHSTSVLDRPEKLSSTKLKSSCPSEIIKIFDRSECRSVSKTRLTEDANLQKENSKMKRQKKKSLKSENVTSEDNQTHSKNGECGIISKDCTQKLSSIAESNENSENTTKAIFDIT